MKIKIKEFYLKLNENNWSTLVAVAENGHEFQISKHFFTNPLKSEDKE